MLCMSFLDSDEIKPKSTLLLSSNRKEQFLSMERNRLHTGMQRPDPMAKEGALKQQLQQLLDGIYTQVRVAMLKHSKVLISDLPGCDLCLHVSFAHGKPCQCRTALDSTLCLSSPFDACRPSSRWSCCVICGARRSR